jgi:hypothetical protein
MYHTIRTPQDYYDRSLEARAALLGCEVAQLCKTMVFENTKGSTADCSDRLNSRYYAVVIQYVLQRSAST